MVHGTWYTHTHTHTHTHTQQHTHTHAHTHTHTHTQHNTHTHARTHTHTHTQVRETDALGRHIAGPALAAASESAGTNSEKLSLSCLYTVTVRAR